MVRQLHRRDVEVAAAGERAAGDRPSRSGAGRRTGGGRRRGRRPASGARSAGRAMNAWAMHGLAGQRGGADARWDRWGRRASPGASRPSAARPASKRSRARLAARVVPRQEHLRDAEAALREVDAAPPRRPRAGSGGGSRRRIPAPSPVFASDAARAAVLEVDEHGERVADDRVGGAARDVDHEAEPAGVVLGGRLVQGPRLWHYRPLPQSPRISDGARTVRNRGRGGRNRGGDRWVAVRGLGSARAAAAARVAPPTGRTARRPVRRGHSRPSRARRPDTPAPPRRWPICRPWTIPLSSFSDGSIEAEPSAMLRAGSRAGPVARGPVGQPNRSASLERLGIQESGCPRRPRAWNRDLTASSRGGTTGPGWGRASYSPLTITVLAPPATSTSNRWPPGRAGAREALGATPRCRRGARFRKPPDMQRDRGPGRPGDHDVAHAARNRTRTTPDGPPSATDARPRRRRHRTRPAGRRAGRRPPSSRRRAAPRPRAGRRSAAAPSCPAASGPRR